MNIQEAVKIAGIGGKVARSSDIEADPTFYYQITNTLARLIMFTHGEQIGIRYEPSYDDLVANDWVVIKKGTSVKGS